MKKAFTLIELLVVIAIIAILAAILFPVFAQAKAAAKQAACLSNMKQIGTGLAMYETDADDTMPPSQTTEGTFVVSWPQLMHPYIKNEDVFVCPATSKGERFAPDPTKISGGTARMYAGQTRTEIAFGVLTAGDGTTLQPFSVNRLSYGRNLIPTNGWQTAGFTGGDKSGYAGVGTTSSLNSSAIEEPAGTIHIVESMTGASGTNDPTTQGNSIRGIQQEIRTDRYNNQTASKVAYRHNSGFIALFGDHHAKYRKWGSTKASEWSIQAD